MGEAPQPVSKVVAISSVAELGDEAMALLSPDLHPVEYVRLLSEKKLYPDAVRFLAHALPKREAVWWAWVSARRAAGQDPPPKIKSALQATEKWISDPTEEHRRAAMAAAQVADLGTAAGCAGLAAFFSSGSLAPRSQIDSETSGPPAPARASTSPPPPATRPPSASTSTRWAEPSRCTAGRKEPEW